MVPPSIEETLGEARSRLDRMGLDHARLEAEILLRHVLEIGRREFLLLDRAAVLSPPAKDRFEELLVRRLAQEPLQYILGRVEFCEFDFRVGPGVLIPRPETEVLVETISRHISGDLGEAGVLVDVGTGTGAIAVSLLARFPQWIGMGVDISAVALGYAQSNAESSGVTSGRGHPEAAPVGARGSRFLPVQSDLLSCLARSRSLCGPPDTLRHPAASGPRVDLVVSNPPYIPTGEIEGLAPEVKDREPRLALDGGVDGMACTRILVSDAARVLRSGGLLALELALGQASVVRAHAESEGFVHRQTYRDLTGRERGVILRRL